RLPVRSLFPCHPHASNIAINEYSSSSKSTVASQISSEKSFSACASRIEVWILILRSRLNNEMISLTERAAARARHGRMGMQDYAGRNAPVTTHFDLDPDQQMILDNADRFARSELYPLAVRMDNEEWWPEDAFPKMGDSGLFGLTIPEAYGGA